MLIVAVLNGALIYIDELLKGIIPITLYAEQYMLTSTGVSIPDKLFEIIFTFGISLIILKFLKKGFEIYVLWTEGDADEEPISLLMNFFKAVIVAVTFPTIYTWLGAIVEDLTDKLLIAIGTSTNYN